MNLVRAFELLKSRTSFPHHLVLAGKWGWRNDELQSTLSTLRFRDHIHFIGYLNPRELETYLPKAAGDEEIMVGVRAAIAEMAPPPAMKDMGTVMKAAMARFAAAGMRVDGKVVSEAVKKELAGK